LLAAAGALALGSGSAASAAVYTWSFTTVETTELNPISGSGSLTTQDVAVGGNYLVTAFSGTWGGVNIQSLLAPGTFGGNDNLLNPLNAVPFTYNGLSFTTASAVQGFSTWNIFAQRGVPYSETLTNNEKWVDGNFVLTLSSAVPEPASWAMMIGGLALAGIAMRRRKVAVSFA
jgi:hypothetical protein